jgi:folate-binding protein YgfZ
MDQNTLSKIPGYERAVISPAIFHQTENGLLKIEGDDQIAFLQRQSTNDLRTLSPDRSALTVLTNPTARILDVLRVVKRGNTLDVITLPGYRQKTLQYLQSRIFFMDKVEITDASAEIAQFHLFGPNIDKILTTRFGELPGPDEVMKISDTLVEQGICINLRNLPMAGFMFLVPQVKAEHILDTAQSLGVETISPEAYEVLRIEAGLPKAGFELTEDYTPLETNLDFAISSSKGCYTGQEVIARQVTYDKITRRMVGLKIQGIPQVGDRIKADGQPVGLLTSHALSPRFGDIGLAVIKRPYNVTSQSVVIMNSTGELPALVVDLPFTD